METPAGNKACVGPGGPAGWGVRPSAVAWVTGKENTQFHGPWEQGECVFLVRQGEEISAMPPTGAVLQPASGVCAERFGRLWGPLSTSRQHQPVFCRAASCRRLRRVGLDLPCLLLITYRKEAVVSCAWFYCSMGISQPGEFFLS